MHGVDATIELVVKHEECARFGDEMASGLLQVGQHGRIAPGVGVRRARSGEIGARVRWVHRQEIALEQLLAIHGPGGLIARGCYARAPPCSPPMCDSRASPPKTGFVFCDSCSLGPRPIASPRRLAA